MRRRFSTAGPVTLDTRAARASVDGVPLQLSALEYRLLAYLMLNRGRVVPRLELIEHIYEQDFERESNTIEVLIGRLAAQARGRCHQDQARPRLRPRSGVMGTRRSLRIRLLLAATCSVVAALVLAGLGLTLLFEQHVERSFERELVNHLNQLTAAFGLTDTGAPEVAGPLSDPRFVKPYGGLYWQIEDAAGHAIRSRSLWDFSLDLPPDPLSAGALHRHLLPGPAGSQLLVVERGLRLGDRAFRLAVAIDRREIDDERARFRLGHDAVAGHPGGGSARRRGGAGVGRAEAAARAAGRARQGARGRVAPPRSELSE